MITAGRFNSPDVIAVLPGLFNHNFHVHNGSVCIALWTGRIVPSEVSTADFDSVWIWEIYFQARSIFWSVFQSAPRLVLSLGYPEPQYRWRSGHRLGQMCTMRNVQFVTISLHPLNVTISSVTLAQSVLPCGHHCWYMTTLSMGPHTQWHHTIWLALLTEVSSPNLDWLPSSWKVPTHDPAFAHTSLDPRPYQPQHGLFSVSHVGKEGLVTFVAFSYFEWNVQLQISHMRINKDILISLKV